MIRYGITEIQSKPSLIKNMDISEIVDKRKNITVGYFISQKYYKEIKPVLEQISKKEKIEKLKKLKSHQDMEFLELGVDDGVK